MSAPRCRGAAAPIDRSVLLQIGIRWPGGKAVIRPLGGFGLVLALAQVSAASFAQEPVFAQEPPRNQTVFERPRPEFAAIGLTTDGFGVFPQLLISESYDDNIRAQADDPEDDLVTEVTAGVAFDSDWNNHALGGLIYGRLNRFAQNSEEDTEEGGVEAYGRLDITSNNNLSGLGFFRRETEDRTDPEEGGEDVPSELDRYLGQLVYRHRVGRMLFIADAQAQRIDFVTPGDNDRDRYEYRFAPRVFYEVTPSFNPFVQVTLSHQDYDSLQGGVDRDSDGAGVFVGAELDVSGVLTTEAFVGYFRTKFDDPSLDNVGGLGGGLSLTWLATDLTSVEVSLSRGEEQTTRASASSRVRTTAELRAEHELLRNVLLESEVLYMLDEFQGIDRSDDIYGVMFGVNYLMNRYATVTLSYQYLGRNSGVNSANFDKNVVLLSTKLQF